MEATTIHFDAFARSRIEEEAAAQGVTVEQLVRHAVMYYLADLDASRARDAAADDTGTAAVRHMPRRGK